MTLGEWNAIVSHHHGTLLWPNHNTDDEEYPTLFIADLVKQTFTFWTRVNTQSCVFIKQMQYNCVELNNTRITLFSLPLTGVPDLALYPV